MTVSMQMYVVHVIGKNSREYASKAGRDARTSSKELMDHANPAR